MFYRKLFIGLFSFILSVGIAWPLAAAETYLLDAGSQQQTVSIAVGDTLRLTLAANPSTGYAWSYAEPIDDGVLIETLREHLPVQPQIAGSGGQEQFTYTAAAAGSSPLRLIYSRPWESRLPAGSFAATVTVQPPAVSCSFFGRIEIDGCSVAPAGPVVVYENRILLQPAAAAALFGAQFVQDSSPNPVLVKGDTRLSLRPWGEIAFRPDQRGPGTMALIDRPEGRLIVLRSLAEELGYQVTWEECSSTARFFSFRG